jgi:PAS domain S-box-containing protein
MGMPDQEQDPGILAVDTEFRITAFSRRAQTLTGFSEEEVLGRRCFDLFCQRDPGESCPMKSCLEKGTEISSLTANFKSKNRSVSPFVVNTLPLRDASGRLVGGLESFRPVKDGPLSTEVISEDLSHLSDGHPQFQKILSRLPDLAASDAPVLLLGENGTGKNLLAKTIHRLSGRASGPWVKIDCRAYRERLLEVELFGCCRSKIHGIDEDRQGRIPLASGGTAFLQEIDSIPGHLQSKLLRFLQDREIEPLGGKQPIPVETRLISASHVDIKHLAEEERFLRDLFFRLSVFLVEIPPLRAMREAIPGIGLRMIQKYNRSENKDIRTISQQALDVLTGYSFPGNMRELDNIIHHAHVLCRGQEIQLEHLPDHIVSPEPPEPAGVNGNESKRMEEIEREVILASLTRNRWSRKRTALELGIDRTTLWRKMRKMGMRQHR